MASHQDSNTALTSLKCILSPHPAKCVSRCCSLQVRKALSPSTSLILHPRLPNFLKNCLPSLPLWPLQHLISSHHKGELALEPGHLLMTTEDTSPLFLSHLVAISDVLSVYPFQMALTLLLQWALSSLFSVRVFEEGVPVYPWGPEVDVGCLNYASLFHLFVLRHGLSQTRRRMPLIIPALRRQRRVDLLSLRPA